MASTIIFMGVCIIGMAILINKSERDEFKKHLDELKELHFESMEVFGRLCYMKGWKDGIENKESDPDSIKDELKQE